MIRAGWHWHWHWAVWTRIGGGWSLTLDSALATYPPWPPPSQGYFKAKLETVPVVCTTEGDYDILYTSTRPAHVCVKIPRCSRTSRHGSRPEGETHAVLLHIHTTLPYLDSSRSSISRPVSPLLVFLPPPNRGLAPLLDGSSQRPAVVSTGWTRTAYQDQISRRSGLAGPRSLNPGYSALLSSSFPCPCRGEYDVVPLMWVD